MYNASNFATDAVLSQHTEKQPHIIYYSSISLNDIQLNYSTIKKEFLVVTFALEKFRSYLIDSWIIIYTDYATLKYYRLRKIQR